MADVIELGQRVKAKYPGQYDDMSDLDVGKKVKAKYPQEYADFTDAPSAPGKSIGGFMGNAARSLDKQVGSIYNAVTHPIDTARALAPAGEAVQLATNPAMAADKAKLGRVKDFATAIIDDYANAYGDWDKVKETLYNDPFRVVGDALSLAGIGAPNRVASAARTVAKVVPEAAAAARGGVTGGAKAALVEVGKNLRKTPDATDAILTTLGTAMGGVDGAAMLTSANRAIRSMPEVVKGVRAGAADAVAKRLPQTPPPLPDLREARALTPPTLPREVPVPPPLPPGKAVPAEAPAMSGAEREFLELKAKRARKKPPAKETAAKPMTAQEAAQGLAEAFPEHVTGAAPKVEAPAPRYAEGARAKKVWNITDKLIEDGWNTNNLHAITEEQLVNNIMELNGQILKDWKAAGAKGPRPNMHGKPSVETIQQIVQEMAETEARKALP